MALANKRGAPRIGSVIVDTPGARQQRAYRKQNPELVREYQREYQRQYRLNNLEKVKQTAKEARIRKKVRKTNEYIDKANRELYDALVDAPNIRVRVQYANY